MDDAIKAIIDGKPAAFEDWKRVYRSMIVHTRGVKPKELLELKRPNEPKNYRDYRLASHKAITKNSINNAIDSVYRILLGSNYVIKPSTNIEKYLKEKDFPFLKEKNSYKQLFFKHILRLIFDDPNGLLVWMPQHPEDSSIPPIFNQPNTTIEVYPVYVKCEQIKYLESDKVAWVAEDKWKVEVLHGNNKKTTQLEPYYFVVTSEKITRLIPFWSKEKKGIDYKEQTYFNLSLNIENKFEKDREFPSLPVRMLGGNISLNEESEIFYDSFFSGFTAFGDEAICAFSDNQVVRARYNFPFTSVKGQKCKACKGAKKVPDEKSGKVTCDACQGSGMSIPFTPFGYYLNEPPAQSDNEAYVNSPFIEFKNPDVAILQNSYDTWKDLLNEARDAVNLLFTKEAQSGIAKEVDREQKYEMLLKISNNFFELIKWSLEIIEAYRVPFFSDRKDQDVRAPVTFSIKTQSQLSEELTDLISKESPASYIATTAKRLSEKMYNDDLEAQKIIEVQTVWDALFGRTATHISQLKATGGAETKDVIKHVHSFSILSKIAIEEDISQMDVMDIIELAEKELAELLPKMEMAVPEETEEETETGVIVDDQLGKLPLALQQLGLAVQRADQAGNTQLSKRIQEKMDELLSQINVEA